MPTYSIQRDSPWVQPPVRGSLAPSESVYSEDLYDSPNMYNHLDLPDVPPLRVQKSSHPSYHAHPQQSIRDNGPRVRQSRLPIFKHVRSMLNRPSRLEIPHRHVVNDELPGDLSEHGGATGMTLSTQKHPYEDAYRTRQDSPQRGHQKQRLRSVRSMSPVSVLRDEELQHYSPQLGWDSDQPPSPVSPVSPVSRFDDDTPSRPRRISGNARPIIQTPNYPSGGSIKRKPAPSRRSTSPENVPPQLTPPSQGDEFQDTSPSLPPIVGSHFSWTTCAPSVALRRPSIDTHHKPSAEIVPQSRFSWSTVNTGMTNQLRLESTPPSPPPALPPQYRKPPVQSILSRHRPIQRMEKETWTPPPRKTSLAISSTTTPTSTKSKLSINSRLTEEHSIGAAKKLPLPPELLTPLTPMTRLETLLTEEQDKVRQRKNIERAISDLTKVEFASPLEVSFAQLRDSKRKLEKLRKTLAEVQLEEREIGIAIARARRKEGEEEGLWVRRVTS